MDRIYLKEIYITNNLTNNKFLVNNITLRNRFKTEEDKLIIFFQYVNDELKLKKEITIIPVDKPTNYKVNTIYQIYLASDNQKENTLPKTTLLGKGRIKEITKDYLILDNLSVYLDDTYTTLETNLFENLNNDINKYKIYTTGLFKIYYYSLIYFLEIYKYYNSGNKISALASYLSITKKLKCNLSYPNVFIKNNPTEMDLLLLKDNVKNNKYYYDIEEVKAIIEIKSCGFINNSENDFKNYIQENFNPKDKKENLKESTITLSNSNIKYIYFSLYERNYRKFSKIIKKMPNRFIGVFCTTIEKGTKFIIPEDYQIPEILKEENLCNDVNGVI